MKRLWKRLILPPILLVLLATTVYGASPIEPTLVAEDQGNGYVYTVGTMGTFSANILSGESVGAVFLSVDSTLYPLLMRNGEEADFQDGVLFTAGSYVLYLYGNEGYEGDYGYFTFTISNDYSSLWGGGLSDITLDENPDLTVDYNETTGYFVYTLPDGETIQATVPRGGAGDDSASLALSEGIRVVKVYLDGVYQMDGDDLTYSKAGHYRLVLRSNEFGYSGDVCYEVAFTFTLGEYVTQSSLIDSPYGMEVVAMTYNGTATDEYHNNYAILQQDGIYTITYGLDGAGVQLTRTVERDTTPPAVYFSQPLGDEVITSEISFTLSDPTAEFELKRNGATVFASRNTIVVDGNYVATITDRYGNSRSYSFTVQMADDNWGGYLAIAGGVAVFFGCLILLRRIVRPRVR